MRSSLIFPNISVGTRSVLIRCRPEGMWCDAAFLLLSFSPFLLFSFLVVSRESSFAQLVFNLYCIGPRLPFQVDAGTMLYRGDCDVHLQTNKDW